MKKVTVIIGHRGGGQILGVFSDKSKIKTIREKVKKFHEEGYVSFENLKIDEPQKKRFGLYFK